MNANERATRDARLNWATRNLREAQLLLVEEVLDAFPKGTRVTFPGAAHKRHIGTVISAAHSPENAGDVYINPDDAMGDRRVLWNELELIEPGA